MKEKDDMIQKTLFLIALIIPLGCHAGDLKVALERGKKLVEALLPFGEEFSRTTYYEINQSVTRGCEIATLSAIKIDGQPRLKYETYGWVSVNNRVARTTTTAILDTAFRLKEWSLETSLQAVPGKATSTLRVNGSKLQAIDTQNDEKYEKEYAVNAADCVWPAAELMQWIKPGKAETFSFSELDPRGVALPPVFNKETKKFEKSPDKTFTVETHLYTVVPQVGRGYKINSEERKDGTHTEFVFDAKGALQSYSTIMTRKDGSQFSTSTAKVISKERMEELKLALQKQ